MMNEHQETFERFIIGALMVDQLSESDSEILLAMAGETDMLKPFKALEYTLKRNALLERLTKGAEMIDKATNQEELTKYKHLYNAIEKNIER